MKENIKKIVVLISSILAGFGFAEWAEVANFINDNVEMAVTAVASLIAVVTALFVKVKDAIDKDDSPEVDPLLN